MDAQAEAAPGGGDLVDRNFNQTFIYRGGKDVPNFGTRELHKKINHWHSFQWSFTYTRMG